VLIAEYSAALPIFRPLDAALFIRSDMAVGAGSALFASDMSLASLHTCGFFGTLGSRPNAMLDTRLLIHISLYARLHAPRRCGIGITDLRIVLLAVNIAAHPILRGGQARALGGRHFAIFQRPALHVIDYRLLPLQARRLTCIQRSGLETVCDSRLLVHIALHRTSAIGCERRASGKSADD
jgi:hypothetical protein